VSCAPAASGRKSALTSISPNCRQSPGWLKQNQLEGDEGIVFLRRTIEANGRSRAFINGRSANESAIERKSASSWWIFTASTRNQSLVRREAQRSLLDHFGDLADLAAATGERYHVWQKIREARLQLARTQKRLLLNGINCHGKFAN